MSQTELDILNWLKSTKKFSEVDIKNLKRKIDAVRSEGWQEGYNEGRCDANQEEY